jgi:hypothetical protein
MLAVCRSGLPIDVPSQNINQLQANGIVWYDTIQKHIVTDSTFRNCGTRQMMNNASTLGCSPTDRQSGCRSNSLTFGFLTDDNFFTPEIMQATRNISFDHCDTKFAFETVSDANSGRLTNWYDVDGSVSGLHEPTIIGSGVESVKHWWGADEEGRKTYETIWVFGCFESSILFFFIFRLIFLLNKQRYTIPPCIF